LPMESKVSTDEHHFLYINQFERKLYA